MIGGHFGSGTCGSGGSVMLWKCVTFKGEVRQSEMLRALLKAAANCALHSQWLDFGVTAIAQVSIVLIDTAGLYGAHKHPPWFMVFDD